MAEEPAFLSSGLDGSSRGSRAATRNLPLPRPRWRVLRRASRGAPTACRTALAGAFSTYHRVGKTVPPEEP